MAETAPRESGLNDSDSETDGAADYPFCGISPPLTSPSENTGSHLQDHHAILPNPAPHTAPPRRRRRRKENKSEEVLVADDDARGGGDSGGPSDDAQRSAAPPFHFTFLGDLTGSSTTHMLLAIDDDDALHEKLLNDFTNTGVVSTLIAGFAFDS